MGGCITIPISECLSKSNNVETHKINNKPKIKIIFSSVVPTIKKNKKKLFKPSLNYKLHIKAFNKIPLRNNKFKMIKPPFK